MSENLRRVWNLRKGRKSKGNNFLVRSSGKKSKKKSVVENNSSPHFPFFLPSLLSSSFLYFLAFFASP